MEEKKPYIDQAEEDKERVEKLIQDDPALLALREEKKSGKKGAKGAKAKPSKQTGVKDARVIKAIKKAAGKVPKKKKAPTGTDAGSDDAENQDPAAGSDEEPAEVLHGS